MRIAEHIGAERQKIPRIEVLIDERHIQPVLTAVRLLPDLLAVGIQAVHCLHHVGNAVLVVVPFVLPILGEQVLAVGEHGGLLRDGHAVIELEPVRLQFVYVHNGLRNVGDLQLLRGQRQHMPALGIAHEHIVRLIQHIGTVAVGTVLLKVDILIHVCVDRVDVVLCIPLVEGVEHLLQMPRFDRHLIVEHADGGVLLDLAFELRHQFVVCKRSASRALSARRKADRRHRKSKTHAQKFCPLHDLSSFSKIAKRCDLIS